MSSLHHTPPPPPPILLTARGIPGIDLAAMCQAGGKKGRDRLRPALEYKEGRARQDLNLLLMDVLVGEDAPEFPQGLSQNPPATRIHVPQQGSESEATLPRSLPHCPNLAEAGGPEPRLVSPTSPPACLPQPGQHGGRPCLLPREAAARPDGADGGREAAKLSV